MFDKIKKVLNLQMIKYLICSVTTMILELIIGLVLIRFVLWNVVVTNTITVLVGALVHYILISKNVFYNEINFKTVIKYIFSFVLGLLLQNMVLTVFYNHILFELSENMRYSFSKIFSVCIPFVITYFVRKKIFLKDNIKRKGK